MKIAICDDERVQLELMVQYCRQWEEQTHLACTIDLFESAESFLFEYEEAKDYDVLFLDIQMRAMSGMDLAKQLRELGESMTIVFITGNPEYVFEGYVVQALDYIVKPVKEEKLFQVLERARAQHKQESYLFIESQATRHKVKQSDILYIESIGHETIIHMESGHLICKKGISSIEKMVDEDAFYRCHRSYLVNVSKIDSINKKEVMVEGGVSLPIARGKWETLNQVYLKFYRGALWS